MAEAICRTISRHHQNTDSGRSSFRCSIGSSSQGMRPILGPGYQTHGQHQPICIKNPSSSGELSAGARVELTVHNGKEQPNDARADAGAARRNADQRY
jgi:hypothetical protein